MTIFLTAFFTFILTTLLWGIVGYRNNAKLMRQYQQELLKQQQQTEKEVKQKKGRRKKNVKVADIQ